MPESMAPRTKPERFEGTWFRGRGDSEYFELLEAARSMFDLNPCLPSYAMTYGSEWNGLREGASWLMWWVQNSYGPSFCALPFLQEPYTTFLQNSNDLWFNQIGDGVRTGGNGEVAPIGSLCDAAMPGKIYYKQGDGDTNMHDWGMEFTAAGILIQAELLLIARDPDTIARYLPLLEQAADFVWSRHEPSNNLFLAGAAANLLAPSYAGSRNGDGTFGKAYLAGLSVTFIGALDRLIELEKLAGNDSTAALCEERRALARKGLPALVTEEGYYIKSLDPDGVRHGVYGAEKHGYFEATVNHDAIALRVADDEQAAKIYERIASLPGLRPHDFIITNYPSLDDTYHPLESIWEFGWWVNGGHWSTCEARMILAYYRLGQYEDARRSMQQMMRFAVPFQLDNPLSNFGGSVSWYPGPAYVVYDAFGPPAAFTRGLFEYRYSAESLTLFPHIPPGIHEIEQRFPIRFGRKQVYISAAGAGPVTDVYVNGAGIATFDETSVTLHYDALPDIAFVQVALGGAVVPAPLDFPGREKAGFLELPEPESLPDALARCLPRALQILHFHRALDAGDMLPCYEAAHARLVVESFQTAAERQRLLESGELEKLADDIQVAADEYYVRTPLQLIEGLENLLQSYSMAGDEFQSLLSQIWQGVAQAETVGSS